MRKTQFGDLPLSLSFGQINYWIMNNIIVIEEEQLAEVVYAAVNRCLDERKIEDGVSKPDDEGYYDRDEICGLLHIAYPTLWRIEKSGLLKSQKVGRKNLYSKAEVNLLMKSGKLAKYNRK